MGDVSIITYGSYGIFGALLTKDKAIFHPKGRSGAGVGEKKTSLPNFDSRVYFGVENGATDAEKHG